MTAENKQPATRGVFSSSAEREKKEITLPSGRKVTVLETTGEAERLLSSIQKNQDLSVINRFLVLVTENLDGKKGKPAESDFKNMLTGDRSFILLNVRKITHGSLVEFNLDCPSCGSKSDHDLDLEESLQEMESYPNGDERVFSVDVGPGKIFFELPSGDTELKIAKTKNPEINTKLRSMKLWEETDNGKFPINLDMLKSKWIVELRKALKENEYKLDTTASVQCPNCNHVSHVDIMGSIDFLFPAST